jgi:hypothetical protein
LRKKNRPMSLSSGEIFFFVKIEKNANGMCSIVGGWNFWVRQQGSEAGKRGMAWNLNEKVGYLKKIFGSKGIYI